MSSVAWLRGAAVHPSLLPECSPSGMNPLSHRGKGLWLLRPPLSCSAGLPRSPRALSDGPTALQPMWGNRGQSRLGFPHAVPQEPEGAGHLAAGRGWRQARQRELGPAPPPRWESVAGCALSPLSRREPSSCYPRPQTPRDHRDHVRRERSPTASRVRGAPPAGRTRPREPAYLRAQGT